MCHTTTIASTTILDDMGHRNRMEGVIFVDIRRVSHIWIIEKVNTGNITYLVRQTVPGDV